jgi:hypothetical protein
MDLRSKLELLGLLDLGLDLDGRVDLLNDYRYPSHHAWGMLVSGWP